MELAVEALASGIDQFEGVRAVAVHVTVAIRQTTIAEQERHLYRGYRRETQDNDKSCKVLCANYCWKPSIDYCKYKYNEANC